MAQGRALGTVAMGAIRTRQSYANALFRRIAARRGGKRPNRRRALPARRRLARAGHQNPLPRPRRRLLPQPRQPGAVARAKDRRPSWVRDLPIGGRAVVLCWWKRVWSGPHPLRWSAYGPTRRRDGGTLQDGERARGHPSQRPGPPQVRCPCSGGNLNLHGIDHLGALGSPAGGLRGGTDPLAVRVRRRARVAGHTR